MADDYPAGKQAIPVKGARAGLAHHLPDSGLGCLRIVGGAGIPPCGVAVQIFQVGQIDLDLSLQSPQGVYSVVSSGVPHHRDGLGVLLQQPPHYMGVMGGVDEVEVVGPLVHQLAADPGQPLKGDCFPEVPVADLLVLAEHTAQGAAREKNGPRAPGAGDRGLLPAVEGSTGQHRQLRHPAAAQPTLLCAQRPAASGAEIADHGVSSSGQKCPSLSSTAP